MVAKDSCYVLRAQKEKREKEQRGFNLEDSSLLFFFCFCYVTTWHFKQYVPYLGLSSFTPFLFYLLATE